MTDLHDEVPEAVQGGADPDVADPDPIGIDPSAPAQDRKSVRAEQRAELLRTPSFLIGATITIFWIACAIVPSLFTSYSEGDFVVDGNGVSVGARQGPSGDAWFGTNEIGQDVFARVIYGADNILVVAPVAAALSVAAGAILGLLMGYYRGWVDELLSRVIEAILSLPVILLAILVLTVFGATRPVVIFTIAGLFTPVVTRTVRAAVMSEAQLDYVTSAKLRGESGWFIMLREILPNVTSVLVVEFTVRVGYAIFTVATLAFLGLSANDRAAADWGLNIADTYGLIKNGQWWISIFPALAIASLVIAVNLIADSIDKVYKA